MARLRMLKPRIGTLQPLLGGIPKGMSASKARDAALPWRKWYKTAKWQRLRMDVLVRDHFKCQRCGHVEIDTSRLVADHRKAHKGDEALFWDFNNLQCLCSGCHNSLKQFEERRGYVKGTDDSGHPADPMHPWNRRS